MRWRNHSVRWVAVATVAWIALLARTSAAPLPSDAELKSVLLFHLTQFIAWPASATNGSSEFVIGILGPDPLGPALDAVVKGETVGGRPIRVIRRNRARDLSGCALLYVSPQHREPLARVMDGAKDPPVLTVGESEEFLAEGGMIRFRKTAERKIRLQVHLTRARNAGFNISAQLLRVADVVQRGDE